MKHKFQNSRLKALAAQLVELDIARAERMQEPCDCEECKPKVKKYRSIPHFGSDYGVSFSADTVIQLNDIASKESVRQGKEVREAEGANLYHANVLAKVIAPVLAAISGV